MEGVGARPPDADVKTVERAATDTTSIPPRRPNTGPKDGDDRAVMDWLRLLSC